MGELSKSGMVIMVTVCSAMIIFLSSKYFGTFVTYAEFNKHEMKDERIHAELITTLKIVIKNQDQIKSKLDLI